MLFPKRFSPEHSDFLLPVSRSIHRRTRFLPRYRYPRIVLVAGLLFLFLSYRVFTRILDIKNDRKHDIISSSTSIPYPDSSTTYHDPRFPPLYEEWILYERSLPQHRDDDPNLPLVPSPRKKYLFMANHAFGVGWGNVLQEMILNAHLAYSTNRIFVFDNYTWDRHESPYSDFKGKRIPSRIPMSAMLSGPLIGDSLTPEAGHNDNIDRAVVPQAVSKEYFRRVCPNPTIINTRDIVSTTSRNGDHNDNRPLYKHEDGLTKMKVWIEKINAIEDPCLEFDSNSASIFDLWFFFQPGILSLWSSLRTSPIITRFEFSPLVEAAFEANKKVFLPLLPSSNLPSRSPSSRSLAVSAFVSRFLPSRAIDSFFFPSKSQKQSKSSDLLPSSSQAIIPGLLTIHIRRGDFLDFCKDLYRWDVGSQGFNSFPSLLDKFDVDDGDDDGVKGEKEVGVQKIVEKDRPGVVKVGESVGNFSLPVALAGPGNPQESKETAKSRLRWERYRKHCLPSIEEIVEKVNDVRRDHAFASTLDDDDGVAAGSTGLNSIYIMSNAPKEWLDELSRALMLGSTSTSGSLLDLSHQNQTLTRSEWEGQRQRQRQRGWDSIHTSRDLSLSWEQRYIAQMVDMYIARRSEVFIGNGFSSLSSNIVMLRMADSERSHTYDAGAGVHQDSTRTRTSRLW